MAKKQDFKGKLIAENRRARFEYHIEDTLEAGIALQGTEVKAMREGKVNIAESYAAPEVTDGKVEMWLINANIPEYSAGNRQNHQPKRPRKLLLHRKEIDRLQGVVERKGYTIIPLKLYFNEKGLAKLLLGIGIGKKLHDKRQTQKDRDWGRQKQRLMRDLG